MRSLLRGTLGAALFCAAGLAFAGPIAVPATATSPPPDVPGQFATAPPDAAPLVLDTKASHAINVDDVTVLRVLDGDTFEIQKEVWPDVFVRANVRVLGENAPEVHSTSPCERAGGQDAKAYAVAWLAERPINLKHVGRDKYGGRVEANVDRADGRVLATDIVADGKAAAYDGGTRQPWCTDPPAP